MARIGLWLLTTASLSIGSSVGQEFYSYVNEDGVKVFTNSGRGGRAQVASSSRSKTPQTAASARSARYDDLISQIASRYDEDEDLVKAIIAVESAFDPNAVSIKNCKGLMQLHPDTASHYGVDDPFDPAQNIEGGVKYLRFLRRNFDDLNLVLAAYNAGEGAVRRYNGIPPYRETEDYVSKVRALYRPPAEDPEVRRKTVYRVVMPDGRILLTNTPSQEIRERAGQSRSSSGAIEVSLAGSGG